MLAVWDAVFCHENNFARSRAKAPNFCRSFSFSSIEIMVLAISFTSNGSKYVAASPKISGMAAVLELAIGVPQAIASTNGFPKVSTVEGKMNNAQL